MSLQISTAAQKTMKTDLKTYLLKKYREIANMKMSETDDICGAILEGQLRLIDQMIDDFDLEES